MATATSQAFAWPIITLDFEASGLGTGTYPIEIGIAQWHGPGTSIKTWSSLISSDEKWLEDGVWKPESVKIHGIKKSDLIDAPSAIEVMSHLNRLCPMGTMAFCDGGNHDMDWMKSLAKAAGIAPMLLLGSWGHVVANIGDKAYDRIIAHGNKTKSAHRAGPDAVSNLKALAYAIGAPAPAVIGWNTQQIVKTS